MRGLGADMVVDYKTEKFEDVAHGIDAVLDTIGGDTQARSWATLRDGGVLVTTVGAVNEPSEAAARGVLGKPFGAHPDGVALARNRPFSRRRPGQNPRRRDLPAA